MSEINLDKIKDYLIQLQETLCQRFEEEDEGAKFIKENWQHSTGGGGCTRVIVDGKVIEKGGINFSHVKGENLPASASAHRPHLANYHFQAIGLSLVIHPINPYVPTVHANLRFFFAEEPLLKKQIWWFGGGLDLTPFYGFTEDCQHWHRTAQAACIPFGNQVYPRYKKWCDEYFYLKHRQESRGIGGLFFDDLNEWEFEKCLAFWQSVGDHFWLAYYPIIHNRKNHPYGPAQRAFQAYRRGRYVEFNLLYDRGTLFGLQSGGRTESILMSLPPQVSWQYNWQPEAGSEEAQLYEKFLPVREWVD